MDPSIPAELLDRLPSFQPALLLLRALLHSPFPPRSLFVHATNNLRFLPAILHTSVPALSQQQQELNYGEDDIEQPDIQTILPNATFIDCAELASQKALFGRILNGLSGWGSGVWDDSLGGVLNWDGRQEGYHAFKSEENGNNAIWAINWDDGRARDSFTASAAKGIMRERKDESLSNFLDGLRAVFDLGKEQSTKMAIKPRFVILHHAENIPGLESFSIGQSEGTLLAAIMRIGELTGKPVIPILISSTEWLLLRPQRGATEPAAFVEMPSLGRKDIMAFVSGIFSPKSNLPALIPEKLSFLLHSFLDLLHQTFEPYLGSEIDDYLWLTDKLWPEWFGYVERADVEWNEHKRLVALFKGTLSLEIEALAELRPLLPQRSQQVNLSIQPTQNIIPSRQTIGYQSHTTPTKASNGSISTLANPAVSHSPLPSPSKRLRSSESSSIHLSLPIISRYLLISAYLASFNPARKDLLMLATEEDELHTRKKKKGGGTRKTPNTTSRLGRDGMIKKEVIPQRLLGPKAFPLERMVAIFECILPVELRSLAKTCDILQEIATLTHLRLLIKTTGPTSLSLTNFTSAAISAFDKLDGIKLKCNNLELESIEALGKSVGFKVAERLWDTA